MLTLNVLGLLFFKVVDDDVVAAYVGYCSFVNCEDTGIWIDIDSLKRPTFTRQSYKHQLQSLQSVLCIDCIYMVEYLLDLQGNLSIVLVQHGNLLPHGVHISVLASTLHVGIGRDILIARHHVC